MTMASRCRVYHLVGELSKRMRVRRNQSLPQDYERDPLPLTRYSKGALKAGTGPGRICRIRRVGAGYRRTYERWKKSGSTNQASSSVLAETSHTSKNCESARTTHLDNWFRSTDRQAEARYRLGNSNSREGRPTGGLLFRRTSSQRGRGLSCERQGSAWG